MLITLVAFISGYKVNFNFEDMGRSFSFTISSSTAVVRATAPPTNCVRQVGGISRFNHKIMESHTIMIDEIDSVTKRGDWWESFQGMMVMS